MIMGLFCIYKFLLAKSCKKCEHLFCKWIAMGNYQ